MGTNRYLDYKKRRRKFPFFDVLVMKQVDSSTTHYRYNGGNITIDISFFFFLFFIRLDIYVYAPIIIYTTYTIVVKEDN
jgi:hypothetical protein